MVEGKVIVSIIFLVIVFFIIGILVLNFGKEQSGAIGKEATEVTQTIGNVYLFAGFLGFLILILIVVFAVAKMTGAIG